MAQDSKSRKLDQYIVRFPEGMRDRIKAEAEISNRSLNAEIIARLETYDAMAKRIEEREERLFTAEAERKYFEQEWEKAAAIVNEASSIDEKRMLLEAERQRNEAQKAALEETKEHVEREMRHLMKVHEQNNAQLALLEKLRTDIQSMSEDRLAIDKGRDEIISRQSELIDQMRNINRDGIVIMRGIMKAVDDAARGDTSALDKMVESARDNYHYEDLMEPDEAQDKD